MERLWLWVARNIPGLSLSHREAAMQRSGISAEALDAAAASAAARYARLDAARQAEAPFIGSADWMRLPLTRYPDFTTWQPFLDEIITHPGSDAFRARHNFRRTIDIPGFHVTTWYDIFQTSVLAAFNDIQARTGTQKLWIGPNEHYFVYASNFWPRDPYFEWFDYWLKGAATGIMNEPALYYSPRAWIDDRVGYAPNDWRHAERWPPPGTSPHRFYLRRDGSLATDGPGGAPRAYHYDPRRPIPTLGGRNMLIDAGPRDQRPAQSLPDYGLIYCSETLREALTIAGAVRVIHFLERALVPHESMNAAAVGVSPHNLSQIVEAQSRGSRRTRKVQRGQGSSAEQEAMAHIGAVKAGNHAFVIDRP